MGVQFPDQRPGAEQEDTGIPVVFATGKEVCRGRGVRLFGEGADVKARQDRCATADIAIAGLRCVRFDPEGDQLPLRRQGRAAGDRLVETVNVANMMIGGQQQNEHIITQIAPHQLGRHGSNGSRIAADRLDDIAGRGTAELIELLPGTIILALVEDNDRRLELEILRGRRNAARRFLHHAELGHEWMQLLGMGSAGKRPQACP